MTGAESILKLILKNDFNFFKFDLLIVESGAKRNTAITQAGMKGFGRFQFW